MQEQKNQQPRRIGNWQILNKIGEGSFGCIYKAKGLQQQEQPTNAENNLVAIKTQLVTNVKQMLYVEYQIYKQFNKQVGIPQVYQYKQEQRYSYMALQLLQTSLDKFIVNKYNRKFAPENVVLQIMIQTLKTISIIHSKGYLYRDFKPSNLMVKSPYDTIFIIDFGLSKKYISNGRHIPRRENKKLVGTPIFCSLNTHAGIQQSRRDDLQSWLWTSLFFVMQLPWESVTKRKQLNKLDQYDQIYKIKKGTIWQNYFKTSNQSRPFGLTKLFLTIIKYVQNLQFEQEPNYNYLQNIIKKQYQSLYGDKMIDTKIDWSMRQPLSSIEINYNSSQKYAQCSPKKIKKINFKVPLKAKNLEQDSNQQ